MNLVVTSGSLLALLFVSGHVAAANRVKPLNRIASYGIDFWREAEGLPQPRIRAITQTRDGYLWLGTDSGLVRFNGASFTSFTVENGNLRDNEVSALQEDDDGGLWIGTYGGGLTLFKEGRFTTFSTADGLVDDVVNKLDKDAEGNIWMASRSGACRFSRGQFTPFTVSEGLSDNRVTAICAGSPLGVFVATGPRLHRFVNGKFEHVERAGEERDGAITQMIDGRDRSLWLGFQSGAIERWRDGSLVRFGRDRAVGQHIYCLYEDSRATVWVSTQRGLHQLRDDRFEPFPELEDRSRLGIVYSLYDDREGSLWIGLESDGLARLRTKQLSTLTSEDGLPNDSIRSVFQDSRGNVWVGGPSGFALLRNGGISVFTTINGARIGTVRSFCEHPDGTVFIGAAGELLTMRAGKLSRAPGWNSRFEIKVLYRDSKDRMWAGTDGGGLFLFDGESVRNYRTEDGLAGNQVRAMTTDGHGALWIGTFGGGVSKFADGRFTSYTTADGLASNRVVAVYEDTGGAMWFATRKGLSRFKDDRFVTYTAESGLLSSFVYAILDDSRGNFWFSCAEGIFRVSKAELSDFAEGKIKRVISVDYGVRDGMRTRACNVGNQPTAWAAADGTLMFCSMKGVVLADPARVASNRFVPPVIIESVAINKETQQPNRDSEVPLGGGEVEIHYAALSYLAPERVRFKYLLEGFDKEWSDAGGRRFAYYASLPPGQYRFRVIAGNIDGAWNETGASFSFNLKPGFYQTRWFLAVGAGTLIFLAWLVYRLRMIELKARYSAVLAERNRIAREIHDTLAQNLAGIALQLDAVAMQLKDVPPELQSRVDQACDLTRYSLAEARRAVTDLRSDELERRELAAALPEIAHKITSNTAIRTRVDVIGAPQRLNPVTEKNLLRIFQEAMANAVKHARAHTIDVELRYGVEWLVLLVKDDGSGFDTDKVIPFEVGHYGLTGMRERAERIGGRFTLKSKPGEGTELLVEVPFSA